MSAVLTGNGGVSKTTAGTVTFSGANTYTGITTINDGTLIIDTTGSIVSNVINAAVFTNKGSVTGVTSQQRRWYGDQ